MNIDRLKQELKDLKRLIGRKELSLRIVKAKLPDLEAKYAAAPTTMNKSEVVMANADRANLEAELSLLVQRRDLLTKQIAEYEQMLQDQPGGPC